MRQANYLVSRAWLVRAAIIVALAAASAAFWLALPGGQSEAAERSKYWLECPDTVTEGDSFTIYLKRDPIPDERNHHYYAYWHTDEGTASASNDYTPLNNVKQSTRETPGAYLANSMPRTIQTTSDPRVEHDETFTIRFTPTWNVRDMNDPDYDDRCEITIENDDEFTVAAETSTDGTKVHVTLNEGVKDHLLLNWLVTTFDFPIGLFYRAVFDVTIDGKWTVPEEADVSGRKITLTMDEPITEGQTVKVAYNNVFALDSLGMFRNGAEITFPNFGLKNVVNRSTMADATGGSSPSISTSLSEVRLTEGSNTTFKVKLGTSPSETVTVDLSSYPSGTTSDDESLVVEPDELTFNSNNWNTWQEVRVAAGEDSDAVNLWSLVTLAASGGNYDDYERYVRVIVHDNDLFQIEGSDVSETSDGNVLLTVEEGESVTYGVKLKRRPAERIDVALETDWSGLTVSPSSLLFNKNNWSTLQTVTVAADGDADSTPSGRYYKVTHSPTGGGYEANRHQSLSLLVDVQDSVPAVTATFEQSSYAVVEGDSVTVKVKLSADPERSLSIPITRVNQDGASRADYSGVPDVVAFVTGDTEKEITFSATADDVNDDGESVKLGFGTMPADVTAGSPNEATISITDDDVPTVAATFEQSSYTVLEGGSATLKVKLSADPERLVTIPITRDDQDGASSDDYSGVPASVAFNPGNTEQEFTFSATADDVDDDGESVKLSFGTLPADVTEGSPNEATVNITDDDVPNLTVNFQQATYTVAEGNTVSVKVTLSADPERTVTVPIMKENQDGASDADYSGVPARVIFNSGDTEQEFTFSATADDVNDDGESVKLGIDLLPSGVTAGSTNETVVSITDDDGPDVTVGFGSATYSVAEGGTVTVTVTLSADPERTVVIPLTKENQDGASDDDYSGVPASVTFNAGDTEQEFTLSATADDVDDGGESVKLGFDTLPTGVTEGSTNETVVSITEDQSPAVTVSFGSATYSAAEGGTVTVTVTLSADPERTVTIPLTKENLDGASDADYSGVPANVTFNPGDTEQEFTFSATADDVDDSGESVKLGFDTLPTGVTEGSTNETVISITVNDDEVSQP